MMDEGYIYCISNESMPGLLKIGMTEKKPLILLEEANQSRIHKLELQYKLEFAKKVDNPSKKEEVLHKLLSQYAKRIDPNRKFFRVSKEEVLTFFELINGKMWDCVIVLMVFLNSTTTTTMTMIAMNMVMMNTTTMTMMMATTMIYQGYL